MEKLNIEVEISPSEIKVSCEDQGVGQLGGIGEGYDQILTIIKLSENVLRKVYRKHGIDTSSNKVLITKTVGDD